MQYSLPFPSLPCPAPVMAPNTRRPQRTGRCRRGTPNLKNEQLALPLEPSPLQPLPLEPNESSQADYRTLCSTPPAEIRALQPNSRSNQKAISTPQPVQMEAVELETQHYVGSIYGTKRLHESILLRSLPGRARVRLRLSPKRTLDDELDLVEEFQPGQFEADWQDANLRRFTLSCTLRLPRTSSEYQMARRLWSGQSDAHVRWSWLEEEHAAPNYGSDITGASAWKLLAVINPLPIVRQTGLALPCTLEALRLYNNRFSQILADLLWYLETTISQGFARRVLCCRSNVRQIAGLRLATDGALAIRWREMFGNVKAILAPNLQSIPSIPQMPQTPITSLFGDVDSGSVPKWASGS